MALTVPRGRGLIARAGAADVRLAAFRGGAPGRGTGERALRSLAGKAAGRPGGTAGRTGGAPRSVAADDGACTDGRGRLQGSGGVRGGFCHLGNGRMARDGKW